MFCSRVHAEERIDAFSLPEQLSSPIAIEDTLLDPNANVPVLEVTPRTAEDQNNPVDDSAPNDDSRAFSEVSDAIKFEEAPETDGLSSTVPWQNDPRRGEANSFVREFKSKLLQFNWFLPESIFFAWIRFRLGFLVGWQESHVVDTKRAFRIGGIFAKVNQAFIVITTLAFLSARRKASVSASVW